MNWNEIEEKYPIAWNALYKYLYDTWDVVGTFELTTAGTELITSGDGVYLMLNLRDLYDFFDYHDIYLAIHKEDIGSDEWDFSYEIKHLPIEFEEYKRRCSYFETILSFQCYGATYTGAWENRIEAEKEAFNKAFEILEKNLNDKDNTLK